MDDSELSEKNRELASWWTPQVPAVATAAAAELPTTPARGIVSFFSENRKEGRWAVPKHLRVLSVFGSVKVDLREAVLQHRETVIEAISVLAEIQIIVPPDVIVECDGDAFMGAFTLSETKRRGKAPAPRPPGAPVVRVMGSAYLANVTVKVRPSK
ncbi:MAG: cell wall-active antibiotics response protein [Gemmatimonadota bacterium]|nr:cell wall-active antibiotics response protein [Gemmatimonadota bacterium]